MTTVEKTILLAIVVLAFNLVYVLYGLNKSIENYGGLHKVIVDSGKELKHISEEINQQD